MEEIELLQNILKAIIYLKYLFYVIIFDLGILIGIGIRK